MAAMSLPAPGTEYGPCVTWCSHDSCMETRQMAATVCRLCVGPIAYNLPCFSDGHRDDLVHAVCLAHEIDTRSRRNPGPAA